MMYTLLDKMQIDIKKQSSLYQPTSFWEQGSNEITQDLKTHGFENFRRLSSTTSYFVPLYAFPQYHNNKEKYTDFANSLDTVTQDSKASIKLARLLSGELSAYADYRTFLSSSKNTPPFTNLSSESTVGNPIEHFRFDNRNVSRSFLNYLLGINFLKQYVDTSIIQTVMEIGGGFGTLGELLLQDEKNNIFYINLDIPPVAAVSTYYLQEIFGKNEIADYIDLQDQPTIEIDQYREQYKAINTCSWHIEKIQGKIDLFVNFISFQEMEPDVVKNYCQHIRRLSPEFILLRNMREGKQKRNSSNEVGVQNPILGQDYDTFLPEYKLIATDSVAFGFTTEDNFHSELRLYIKR